MVVVNPGWLNNQPQAGKARIIDNHRLYEGDDAVKSAGRWEIFLRLNEALTADSTPETLMSDVLTSLISIPEIESCWIGTPDKSGIVVPRAWLGAFTEEFSDSKIWVRVAKGPFSEGPAGQAWRSGQPVVINNWRTDPSVAAWQAISAVLNWQSCAAVPLCGHAGAHSLLVMYSNVPGFFSAVWHNAILKQLAAVIGNALENRQKHEALQRSQQLYRTLLQGADILLSARSEKQVLQSICKKLIDSQLFSSASIGRIDADGHYNYMARSSGKNKLLISQQKFQIFSKKSNQSLARLAWDAGKTMVSNFFTKDAQFSQLFEAVGDSKAIAAAAAAAAIPLKRGEALWAVMFVTSPHEDFFNAELIQLLEQLSSMVGRVLDELDLKASLHAEQEAQHRLARVDFLTGLPNRLGFQEQIETAMAHARQAKKIFCIVILDLNNFKRVNDFWGMAAGDTVIHEIAQRIKAVLRSTDFAARINGDAFALIFQDWVLTDNDTSYRQQIQAAVQLPVTLPNGETLHMSFSAGISLFTKGVDNADMLINHANQALFAAKAEHNDSESNWRFYGDIEHAAKDQVIVRALLQHGALEVHYQPVLNLQDGQVTAVEGLARLRDGDRLIMPVQFLPGLHLDDRVLLFKQVLHSGLKQLRAWDHEGMPLNLSVNVDAQILLLDGTLPYILETLAATGLEATRLVLEILETHDFFDFKAARERIEEIRARGVKIALDDLGVGYSSILKMRELPLDVVKLDRAFIGSLRERPDDLLFVSVMQTLTAMLSMQLIVEGVEDDDVLDALRVIGVGKAQGFGIAKPMSAVEITAWLRQFEMPAIIQEPGTLLGAYAVHSNWLRSFQFWRKHPPVLNYLRHDRPFSLVSFFAANDGVQTQVRDAYETFQALLQYGGTDRQLILDASHHFQTKLVAALNQG